VIHPNAMPALVRRLNRSGRPMPECRVEYFVDSIEAESPEDAARQALAIMRDASRRDNQVFEVWEADWAKPEPTRIDLVAIDEERATPSAEAR
jgi:hypothetical protein